jgi:hypothetical protein
MVRTAQWRIWRRLRPGHRPAHPCPVSGETGPVHLPGTDAMVRALA